MTPTAHGEIPVNPSDHACIDLVNSSFTDYLGAGGDTDRIASPEWQRWFVDRYELTPSVAGATPVEALVALRRELRRILEKWARGDALTSRDVRALDTQIRAAPLRQRVTRTADGLNLLEEPIHRDWTWVIASIASSAVDLMLTGDPRRLKTCTNPNCSWMFYDVSVNRSRQFCTPTPCALLIRMRRFRARA